MPTLNELRMLQALPFEVKVAKSKLRIEEWYRHHCGEVYISYSGGFDSTTLLHLVRSMYPEVTAVFSDTGLEYPELRDHVKKTENVVWVKPVMTFKEVINKHGYPVVSKLVARMVHDIRNPTEKNEATRTLYYTGVKRDGTISKHCKLPNKWHTLLNAPFEVSNKCCKVMKHDPIAIFEKHSKLKAFVGTTAEESKTREGKYLQTGCNNYKKGGISQPLGFWTRQDIMRYLVENNLYYPSVYGEIKQKEDGTFYNTGVQRTGCMFCMFGVHLEKEPNRFQQMQHSHPHTYDYCINKLKLGEVMDYIGVKYWNDENLFDLLKED